MGQLLLSQISIAARKNSLDAKYLQYFTYFVLFIREFHTTKSFLLVEGILEGAVQGML